MDVGGGIDTIVLIILESGLCGYLGLDVVYNPISHVVLLVPVLAVSALCGEIQICLPTRLWMKPYVPVLNSSSVNVNGLPIISGMLHYYQQLYPFEDQLWPHT